MQAEIYPTRSVQNRLKYKYHSAKALSYNRQAILHCLKASVHANRLYLLKSMRYNKTNVAYLRLKIELTSVKQASKPSQNKHHSFFKTQHRAK